MANPDQPTPSASGSSSSAPWILLVDDEPAMRQLIETVLGNQNLAVRLADGATAAMSILNSALTPPALLICDVLMPGVDGLELTRRLLARLFPPRRQSRLTPIIPRPAPKPQAPAQRAAEAEHRRHTPHMGD